MKLKELIAIGSGLMMLIWIGLGLVLVYGTNPPKGFNDISRMILYLGTFVLFSIIHVITRSALDVDD